VIDARFVPIADWPGRATPSCQQKKATFRASYPDTLDLLEKELNHLGAKGVLIQAYFDRKDIRNDGWPRASARPKQQGVIVTFEKSTWSGGKSTVNTMSFPCDTFNGWEDNLRAIAKSLEALRMVDRYGVTRNNEQYRGFTALPAPEPVSSRDAAIEFLSQVTAWPLSQVSADPRGAYREACRTTHPDTGGTHELFLLVQRHGKAVL
jgi:hypothetical protein